MKNKYTTLFKHYISRGYAQAGKLIQKNKYLFLTLGVLALVVSIILISLPNRSNAISSNEPRAVKASEKLEPTDYESLFTLPKEIIPSVLLDTNLANTFSNIGFIINPEYAIKHNISPAIVATKRRICLDYVARYAKTAQQESDKFGIPASITLAQALLESNAGASKLARENNNHFGIKCFSKTCATGHCTRYTDDSHKDFFRKYNSVWESYRAHSSFLKKPRYQHLFRLKSTDYKGWAKGLSKYGYATDPKYAQKLIRIIEELQLYKFDT